MIDENIETVQETGESETPSVPQSNTEQTPSESSTDSQNPALQGAEETTPERTVPYSALKEAREEIRRLKREYAKTSTPQLDGADDEQIMSHPFVTGIMGKLAEYELKEGAKDILEHYPQLPKNLTKQILRNPRGFLNSDTQDVPTGLLDIEEYVQQVAQAIQDQTTETNPQPTNVRVVENNSTNAGNSAKEMEIQEIMKIPSEDWTPEQLATVKSYTSKNKR